jgi:hypothetical protein
MSEQARLAAFLRDSEEAKRENTLGADKAYEKKVFLELAAYLGLPKKEISSYWETESNPAEVLRTDVRYGGLVASIYPFRQGIELRKLLSLGIKSALWQFFQEQKRAEEYATIVVFPVRGLGKWVLTDKAPARRKIGVGRIIFPSAGLIPDVYAIPLTQFKEENPNE